MTTPVCAQAMANGVVIKELSLLAGQLETHQSRRFDIIARHIAAERYLIVPIPFANSLPKIKGVQKLSYVK